MGALETTHVNIFIRNLKSMIRGKFTKLQHLTVTIADMMRAPRARYQYTGTGTKSLVPVPEHGFRNPRKLNRFKSF